MKSPARDPRFLEGIRCFNHRAFFEAHEVWEDIWRDEEGPARRFYQGLIQLAVCLHHFGNGNTRGAKKLCLSGSATSNRIGRHTCASTSRVCSVGWKHAAEPCWTVRMRFRRRNSIQT